MIRAAAAHGTANLLLLWLGYYWLGIGESRGSALAWSILMALGLVCLCCWTYGAAFVYFRDSTHQPLTAAWRLASRNLLPLIAAAVLVAAVYLLLARAAEASSAPALKIASYLTLKLRKPVRPAAVLRIFSAAFWLVRWVVLPVLLAPMLSAIAERGWPGWGKIGSMLRARLYWVEAPVLLLCALWVPWKLLGWAPHLKSFGMEMTSFVLRALAAYLLFVAGWLALAFVTSGGRPRWTQPRTAPSP